MQEYLFFHSWVPKQPLTPPQSKIDAYLDYNISVSLWINTKIQDISYQPLEAFLAVSCSDRFNKLPESPVLNTSVFCSINHLAINVVCELHLQCGIFLKTVVCRRVCFVAKEWAVSISMTLKSHVSVVFRELQKSTFRFSLEPWSFAFEGKKNAGEGSRRPCIKSSNCAIFSLSRRQFGPTWAEDALYCKRSVSDRNRYLGACNRYHLWMSYQKQRIVICPSLFLY